MGYTLTAAAAAVLIIVSFYHRSYALRMACRVSALVYFFSIYINKYMVGYAEHWTVYAAIDGLLLFILARLGVPAGALVAILASMALGVVNIMAPYGWLYDHYEPLAITINAAFMYYLAVFPFVHRRDRRWRDHLPT